MDEKVRLTPSFMWLNVTQFLGAMNDNVFKLLVIFLLVEPALLGLEARAKVVTMASAVFVVPFLLFSHAAGVLADRISKRNIVVFTKAFEVAVMTLGCVAVYFAQPLALYGILFLMCTQSALFGPSKYGIIPELVKTESLSKANSFLVGSSYLAIIIGTFIPTFLLLNVLSKNFLLLGSFCVAVAVIGLLASLRIRPTPAVGKKNRFSAVFVVDLWRTLRDIRHDKYLFLAVISSAYFLFLGGFIQQNALLYGQDYLGMGWIESGYLFPVAALGIGVGALLAGKMSGRNIEFGLVPIGALGLTGCCIAFACIKPDISDPVPALASITAIRGLGWITYLTKPVVWVLFLLGVSSGLFVVPLNAFIQYRSPPDRRGEILALNNFLSFVGVAVSAGVFALLYQGLKLRTTQCFAIVGVLTGLLAVTAIRILPDFLIRFVVVVVTKLFYRIRVEGLQHLPVDGPALIVSNHVTWVDALLISAPQQRRIRFVMARHIAEYKPARWLFRLMRVIPVSPSDPPRQIVASLAEARHALERGYIVCIFAEGAITRNGNMRGFKPGLERIVRGTGAPIIPAHIGGAWGSIFSYYHGRLLASLPSRVPYPVTILFGDPLPTNASSETVRRRVLELSADSFHLKKGCDRTLGQMFIQTARVNWNRLAMWDTTGKRVTYLKALAGAIALSRKVGPMCGDQEMVGVLLPSSVGGALVNAAIVLLGKVPVNLNFTASASAVESAVSQCGIKTVISSRAFLEKLGEDIAPEGTACLEDITATVGGGDRLRSLLTAVFCPARRVGRVRDVHSDSLATVIFSSGSTGDPKGIMLSHHNVLSNVEQVQMVFHFTPRDRMCAVLPFFHSFGYTVTLWCPLIIGFPVYYHPNPLDGTRIMRMIRENALTLLLATPTFLLGYIRKGKREDLTSLRLVMTGAEKLKARVADAFEKRFGMRPLEGYGATELSPVASANLPDVAVGGVLHVGTKEGSIGHPVPGVAVKICDPDTEEDLPPGEEGVLMVRGPNVMMGYLGNPDMTSEVLRGGWYNTGDIARIDEDGFVHILDRMSRYSKLGGEMVPHLAVEEKLIDALGATGQVLVVTGAPDERKGEQLVVLYTDEAGDAAALQHIVKESALPNLWKPRKDNFFPVASMPTLGSGKLDLKRIRQIAREFVDNRPGIVRKTVEKIQDAL